MRSHFKMNIIAIENNKVTFLRKFIVEFPKKK